MDAGLKGEQVNPLGTQLDNLMECDVLTHLCVAENKVCRLGTDAPRLKRVMQFLGKT